jgi:hypothetical protein
MRFFQDTGKSPALSKNNSGDLQALSAITDLMIEERIKELMQLRPPEQFKEYAKLMGSEQCRICGFNSEVFRRHIDDRLAELRSLIKGKS